MQGVMEPQEELYRFIQSQSSSRRLSLVPEDQEKSAHQDIKTGAHRDPLNSTVLMQLSQKLLRAAKELQAANCGEQPAAWSVQAIKSPPLPANSPLYPTSPVTSPLLPPSLQGYEENHQKRRSSSPHRMPISSGASVSGSSTSRASQHSLVFDSGRSQFGHSRSRSITPEREDARSVASYRSRGTSYTAARSTRTSSLDRQKFVIVQQGKSGIDWQFIRAWTDLVMKQNIAEHLTGEMHNFFHNILLALNLLVSGNPEEQQTLADAPQVRSALVKLTYFQHDALRDQALLLLSQLALSHWETAVEIIKEKGLMERLEGLLLDQCAKVRDSAALLINNIAGSGGEPAIVTLAQSTRLIQILVSRLVSEDSLELQRITSALNHISRSTASSRALRKLKAQEGLVRLLSKTRFCQEEAWMGLATMALANLQGTDDGVYFSANQDTLPHLVEFLRCAIDKIKLNGIYFRVYDVVYSVAHLCSNSLNHAVLHDSGLVEVLCHIVSNWKPGMYEWGYSVYNASTYPALERSTTALYDLCETQECRETMTALGMEDVCERLMCTEEAQVKEYAAKVLWRLRDRQNVLYSLERIVHHVDVIRINAARFGWTENERTTRLSALLESREQSVPFGQLVTESVRWMKDSLQFDRMERIRHLMLGTQRSSARVILLDWGRLMKRNSKARWQRKWFERIRQASLKKDAFHCWRQNTGSQAVMRRKLAKGVLKWIHQGVRGAFNVWLDLLKEKRRIREVCMKLTKRWINMQLAAPFYRWQENYFEARRLRFSQSRVIRKWMNRGLNMCFESWKTEVEQTKHEQNIIQKIVTRWNNMPKATAFVTWYCNTKERQRERKIVSRIVVRWTQRSLLSSFEKWRAEHKEQEHLRKIIQKIVTRWNNMPKATAFVTWYCNTKERQRERKIVSRIVVRWTQRSLLSSFEKWKAEHKEQEHLRKIIQKIVTRWNNMPKATAFVTWYCNTKERQRERKIVSRIVVRWTQRSLLSSFEKWRAQRKEQERLRKIVSRILLTWTHRLISAALKKWRVVCNQNSGFEALVNSICKRLVGQWLRLWHETTVHNMVLLKKMCTVLKRNTWSSLLTIFSAWHRVASASRCMAPKISYVLCKWSTTWLSTSFAKWRSYMALIHHQELLASCFRLKLLPSENNVEKKNPMGLPEAFMQWSLQLAQRKQRRFMVLLVSKTRSLNVCSRRLILWAWHRLLIRRHYTCRILDFFVPYCARKRCSQVLSVWMKNTVQGKLQAKYLLEVNDIGNDLIVHSFASEKLGSVAS